MLQLHGRETPERVAEVRARFGLPVMKAVGVADEADLAQLDAYAEVADQLLVDARAAARTRRGPGGNGARLRLAADPGPALAAAVDAGRRADAGERRRGGAADRRRAGRRLLGRRERPGYKDPERVRAFVRGARGRAPEAALELIARRRRLDAGGARR